ncbi:hypothetical protein J1792_31405 [Streptomyces triculaminicus]|uniref:Uncharacterized protein n=2 Tax=Streptomyces TaxID=1883 RepID=A0A939FUL0_9ACTN|nr:MULTISPECIES: hypothetical protein [Streptomyces]MBO0657079.1 hypothetical protein [Streptomyces triculaminicus]QSY49531.1 hypothetical protein J3S04_32375 [Streptomyces griseocarneus]
MDVLTWTVERRVRLAERAELLRKELAEIEAEVARMEAAEVAFGQWDEAADGGRRPSGIVSPEPERVVAGPGAGGMRPVPDKAESMGVEVPPPEYRRIMERGTAFFEERMKAIDPQVRSGSIDSNGFSPSSTGFPSTPSPSLVRSLPGSTSTQRFRCGTTR